MSLLPRTAGNDVALDPKRRCFFGLLLMCAHNGVFFVQIRAGVWLLQGDFGVRGFLDRLVFFLWVIHPFAWMCVYSVISMLWTAVGCTGFLFRFVSLPLPRVCQFARSGAFLFPAFLDLAYGQFGRKNRLFCSFIFTQTGVMQLSVIWLPCASWCC